MTERIVKTLEELGIERILFADDSEDNTAAARQTIGYLPAVTVDYCPSGGHAIKELGNDNYDLIITDLEMETPARGLDVVKEGLRHGTYSILITGRDASGGHGATTTAMPLNKTFKGEKSDPDVIKQVYETAFEALKEDGTYQALERRKKYLQGRPLEEPLTTLLLDTYEPHHG